MKQLVFLFNILILGCTTKKNDPELYQLTGLLTGKFSSQKQFQKEFRNTDTYLVNTPIWEDKPDYWFYSEIYNLKTPSLVYFQRVLHLQRIDSVTIKSTSYNILNPQKYNNGWRDKTIFKELSINNLEVRNGCDVYYKKKTSSIYVGKTNNHSCISQLNDVAFTVSNLIISNNKISVWNREYNMDGKQVWNRLKNSYRYQRISN